MSQEEQQKQQQQSPVAGERPEQEAEPETQPEAQAEPQAVSQPEPQPQPQTEPQSESQADEPKESPSSTLDSETSAIVQQLVAMSHTQEESSRNEEEEDPGRGIEFSSTADSTAIAQRMMIAPQLQQQQQQQQQREQEEATPLPADDITPPEVGQEPPTIPGEQHVVGELQGDGLPVAETNLQEPTLIDEHGNTPPVQETYRQEGMGAVSGDLTQVVPQMQGAHGQAESPSMQDQEAQAQSPLMQEPSLAAQSVPVQEQEGASQPTHPVEQQKETSADKDPHLTLRSSSSVESGVLMGRESEDEGDPSGAAAVPANPTRVPSPVMAFLQDSPSWSVGEKALVATTTLFAAPPQPQAPEPSSPDEMEAFVEPQPAVFSDDQESAPTLPVVAPLPPPQVAAPQALPQVGAYLSEVQGHQNAGVSMSVPHPAVPTSQPQLQEQKQKPVSTPSAVASPPQTQIAAQEQWSGPTRSVVAPTAQVHDPQTHQAPVFEADQEMAVSSHAKAYEAPGQLDTIPSLLSPPSWPSPPSGCQEADLDAAPVDDGKVPSDFELKPQSLEVIDDVLEARHSSFDSAVSSKSSSSYKTERGGPMWALAAHEAHEVEEAPSGGSEAATARFAQALLDQTKSRAEMQLVAPSSSDGTGSVHVLSGPRPADRRGQTTSLLIVGIAGLLLGWLGNFFTGHHCHYVSKMVLVGPYYSKFYVHYGLWKYSPVDSTLSGYTYCYPYTQEWETNSEPPLIARGINLVAMVAGTYTLCVLWFYLISGRFTQLLWIWAVRMAALTAASQVLTLLIFVSDLCWEEKCYWGPGASLALVTGFIWVVLGYEMIDQAPYKKITLHVQQPTEHKVEMTKLSTPYNPPDL